MFIFHDLVDLFAFFGLMQLGRVLMKRSHLGHSAANPCKASRRVANACIGTHNDNINGARFEQQD
jgi:hypothetical protein